MVGVPARSPQEVQCPLSGGHLSELIDGAWLNRGRLTQVIEAHRYKCLSRRRTFRSLRLETGPRRVQLTKMVRMRRKKKRTCFCLGVVELTVVTRLRNFAAREGANAASYRARLSSLGPVAGCTSVPLNCKVCARKG